MADDVADDVADGVADGGSEPMSGIRNESTDECLEARSASHALIACPASLLSVPAGMAFESRENQGLVEASLESAMITRHSFAALVSAT